jgi:hypothetical protein
MREEGAGGRFDQVARTVACERLGSRAKERRLIGERERPNYDLGLSRRRFVHLGCRPFARTAGQGQAALGERLGNEIHGQVPAAFWPFRGNARCQAGQRSPVGLPLKISPLGGPPNTAFGC